jgi:hypothetical protein
MPGQYTRGQTVVVATVSVFIGLMMVGVAAGDSPPLTNQFPVIDSNTSTAIRRVRKKAATAAANPARACNLDCHDRVREG